jgi:hypothetical protein
MIAIALTTPLCASATTDCPVKLASVFLGDVGGGTYAVFLAYTYTNSAGSVVNSSGYMPLGTGTVATSIAAAALSARVTGQSVTIRYQNNGGGTQDAVCGGTAARTDLIGIWF